MEIVLISVLSLTLAFNIGANNAASSMSTVYGSKMLTKLGALSLAFVFVFLGGSIAGENVVTTVGKELLKIDFISLHSFLIYLVLLVPIISIIIANKAKIPIATTHIVVCTIFGIGLSLNALNLSKASEIVLWWIITPIGIWLVNYIIGKYVYFNIVNKLISLDGKKTQKIHLSLRILVISSACFLALFAGANNAANAAAPIVGLDLISAKDAALISGFFMALGALIFGGGIIENIATKITSLSLIRAVSVNFTGGTFLAVASFYGIPISMAEIITSGIIGFSCSTSGFKKTFKNKSVLKILAFWIFAPIICVGLSFYLTNIIGNIK
tara:strand:+ start:10408 stop:11388 length:981 start_codon:yes stop_codon:yes gene_type:complete